jgi:hypothetical protein
MALRVIDLDDPILSPLEAEAFRVMLEKREYYIAQCRPREAHGAGAVIQLLWNTLHHFETTVITNYGDLDTN